MDFCRLNTNAGFNFFQQGFSIYRSLKIKNARFDIIYNNLVLKIEKKNVREVFSDN